MTHESVSQTPPIFTPDGSINEAVLRGEYGLGKEEAMQVVSFGDWRGTVAQMLADRRCPVGGRLREAFQKDGIGGVLNQFSIVGMMDSRFSITISEKTLEIGGKDPSDVKKKQIFPNPPQIA